MAWFTRSEHKKPAVSKEALWEICPRCKAHVYKEEWQKALKVCPKCNYHGRLTAQERVQLTLDSGSFESLFDHITPQDPLHFSDGKATYASKAEESRAKTGLSEAILTGTGKINGLRTDLGIMDFRFLGGSLGSGTGEKFRLIAEHALKHRIPLIIFSASGGARMHEGIVSLMQIAKTCAAVARLNDEGIPYISVLTDPTTGGVSASFAMVGDLNIAEPGALIGFAGRRVIEETIKQKLPDDFQTSEYLLQHGFVDSIVNRNEMKGFLHKVLCYWTR